MNELLREWVCDVADKALHCLVETTDGEAFFPGGHNGPYYDIESPVRNTAHWLITFSFLYKEKEDERYFLAASKLSRYLLNCRFFIKDGVYVHRQKTGKDWCNGVIGQAWVIEALYYAGVMLNDRKISDAARNASASMVFNSSLALWSKKDPGNGKVGYDYTLNHQVWLAMAKSLLSSDDGEVVSFLDLLNEGAFRVREDGLISHMLYSNSLKGLALRARYRLSELRSPSAVREKEVGYHLFNLHPLAVIYNNYSSHPFFASASFSKSLAFSASNKFLEELKLSHYAFPYNSPLFEFPAVIKQFGSRQDFSGVNLSSLFSYQKQILSGTVQGCEVPDVLTLLSRVYEGVVGYDMDFLSRN